jgi:aspartate/methionine/tyrosine aminotransferase
MRRVIGRALASPGVPCAAPPAAGAFYCFVDVFAPMDAMTLAERLIREHQVAVIPGSAFGAAGCSARVSYGALDLPTAEEGARRLAAGLRALAGP